MVNRHVRFSHHSRWGRGKTLVWMAACVTIGGPLHLDLPHPVQAASSETVKAETCAEARECFAAAAWPSERLGNTLTKEQVRALKLERLRQVMERFPASLWAKRAGLMSGLLLMERNPAGALTYLRAARRDFPVLEDYIQVWTGEALLRLGETREAAMVFEAIPDAVPDSHLLPLIAVRAGEAWYQASSCPDAIPWLTKAVSLNDKDPKLSSVWLQLADCQLRTHQLEKGKELLKKLWIKFPHTKEAKEAESLLETNIGGEFWVPQPEELYARAQAFMGQAWHADAIEELKKLLAKAPTPSLRSEAMLKLGIANVRLKRYDQARAIFQELVEERTAQSGEASVWLARVYLRQGLGEQLQEFSQEIAKRSLSAAHKGQITLFSGIRLEDQGQFDEAITKYRQVAQFGEPTSQRIEAQWREGWVLYRMGRYQEAISVWQSIVDQRDGEWEPQALYWIARSYSNAGLSKAGDVFQVLCTRYPYTYYCQLAKKLVEISGGGEVRREQPREGIGSLVLTSSSLLDPRESAVEDGISRIDIARQPAYRRAVELRALGLEQDAARELTVLTALYSLDENELMALSMMLNEVGAYHHAMRLVRARFRDRLERTGGDLPEGVWEVAYPTGLIPTIKMQTANGVDPFLVAAIIREESQYDWSAVSRVGAIGLMQIMPSTAKAVAERYRLPAVTREDLFDQETNIRIGVRYLEELLEQFSGNVVQAVAAYNAGPVAVESWVAAFRGRSEDEFVELIPFQETRQYVKRVLRSYKEYIRLAGLAKTLS